MRHTRQGICSAAAAGSIAFVSLIAATNGPAAAAEAPCAAPADLVRLDLPLERTARQLASRKLTLIVALGSSSTAGSGASSPGASYPSRLMAELAHRFPTEPLMVLNRGIAGERAVDMLARFDDAVASEHPDLVLWQLGTNAVLRGYEHAKSDSVIREGIRRIKATGADAVLIDPQYAPKVIARSQARTWSDLISSAAAQEKVDVFHRFGLMRYWQSLRPHALLARARGTPVRDIPRGGWASHERLGPQLSRQSARRRHRRCSGAGPNEPQGQSRKRNCHNRRIALME
jgi:acyl-CoA thioesterase-1